jgi:hypothetical protein
MMKKALILLFCILGIIEIAYTQQNTQTLFAIAGQSNAAGLGKLSYPLVNLDTNQGRCHEYLTANDVFVERSQDPFGEDVYILGSDNLFFNRARTISAWPSFAKRYIELMKVKTGKKHTLFLVQTAKSGSGCHKKSFTESDNFYNTWSEEDLLFFKSQEKINNAMSQLCIPLSGIIWLQGESDAQAIRRGDVTKEEYKVALTSVIARYREAFGATLKFYIIKTARAWIRSSECNSSCAYNSQNFYYCCLPNNPLNGYDQVREAQEEIASGDPNTFIVFDHPTETSTATPNYSQIGYYHDGTHYIKSIYETIGFRVATKIFNLEKIGFVK